MLGRSGQGCAACQYIGTADILVGKEELCRLRPSLLIIFLQHDSHVIRVDQGDVALALKNSLCLITIVTGGFLSKVILKPDKETLQLGQSDIYGHLCKKSQVVVVIARTNADFAFPFGFRQIQISGKLLGLHPFFAIKNSPRPIGQASIRICRIPVCTYDVLIDYLGCKRTQKTLAFGHFQQNQILADDEIRLLRMSFQTAQ